MKGFTLIEIIIASATALVVGVLLIAILGSNTRFFYHQSGVVSEGLGLNDTLQVLSNDIRQAAQVATAYPTGSPVYTTSSTTLVLKIPALSGANVISNVYDYIVVTQDTTNPRILREQVFPDSQSSRLSSNKVLTPLAEEIRFDFLDKDDNSVGPSSAVKVKVTLKVTAKTGSVSSSNSSTIITSLRNL